MGKANREDPTGDLTRLKVTWDTWARTDALWAVLTDWKKKGGRWDLDDFFGTGTAEVDRVLGYLRDQGLDIERGSALDFGCGVGRLSQAWTAHFEKVSGVDISPTMIEIARRYNRQGSRCEYYQNEAPDLAIFADESFDFVYSALTLQHISPPLQARYLLEFLRVLKPTGLIGLHIIRPTRLRLLANRFLPRSIFDAIQRLRYRGPVMEVNPISPAELRKLLQGSPGSLVGTVADARSYTYFIRRTPPGN
jgi:ubiquinone/menaquinone biosynthesis C-methylase UbiE